MKLRKITLLLALGLLLSAAMIPLSLGPESAAARSWSLGLGLMACMLFIFPSLSAVRLPVKGAWRGSVETAPDTGVTFSDVAANAHALKSLEELTDFLKTPERFRHLGARIPHGVLLYGPPGTGKTLMARALAGEAGVPFIAMNGSDFVEMYVGVGASRVREVFKKARKLKKCVIFIDEIDSLGRARGANSSDERDQTLNALLSEMSGFHPSEGIIVVAATNRVDTLDAALLRPGRFDRQIEVGLPGAAERRSILALHARNKPLAAEVDLSRIAAQTVFFSGASLENLMNEAAIRAARRGGSVIENADIREAYLTLIAGEEKETPVTSREKGILALHEAAHAVSAHILQPETRLTRVSVIPSTGGAAGYNLTVPAEKLLYTREEMKRQIAVLLAGRAAEEMILGEENVTGGAMNDLKRAGEIAANMASELGLGAEMFVSAAALSRLGGTTGAYSAAHALLEEEYERTKALLNENIDLLMALTEKLMEREALEEEELNAIFSQSCVSNDSQASTK